MRISESKPTRLQLAGVFLIACSILILEIALTRIFSVTLWYHFAFLSISMALLGSATAGIAVFSTPGLVLEARAQRVLPVLPLIASVAILVCFLLYLSLPRVVIQEIRFEGLQLGQIGLLLLVFVVLAIPFFFGSAGLALALTRWSGTSGRVYFADLAGASMGCLLSVLALNLWGGTGAVIVAALIMAAAAAIFSLEAAALRVHRSALAWAGLLLALLIANQSFGWISISANKGGGVEPARVFEKWNSFSRVTVYEPEVWHVPFGWALSSKYEGPDPGHALLLIDALAGTPIQRWEGDLETVEFLKWDLTSLAFYLTEEPNVLIIGPGGGRDVLAALAFNARAVTGVELNPAIVDAVQNQFGEYSGNLYDHPKVTIEVGDARSYVAQSEARYDIIQASLVDTFAATSAGAFALSENSLYTREAFVDYYNHLTEDGVLTLSRWYLDERPAETLRLVSLSLGGWEAAGVTEPGGHIVVIANRELVRSTEGMATIILKRSPFTLDEIGVLLSVSEEMGFDMLYAPALSTNGLVHDLIVAEARQEVIDAYPLDISIPTDDRPFFFNLVRYQDLLAGNTILSEAYSTAQQAAWLLIVMLLFTVLLSVAFVLVPLLWLERRRAVGRPASRYIIYIAMLGVGFLLLELPTVQRLTVYLGSPTYSLTVVLFTFLLAAGLGSRASQSFDEAGLRNQLLKVLTVLVTLGVAHSLLLPSILARTIHLDLVYRLAINVLTLAPIGFFMGMPFPLGIRLISAGDRSSVAWMWSINAVMSVLGATLSVALSVQFGFRFATLLGVGAYCIAFLSMALPERSRQQIASPVRQT